MDITRTLRILHYIEGRLSAEERAAFEEAQRTAPALFAEVQLYRTARVAVRAQRAIERNAQLRQRSMHLLRYRLWWWKLRDKAEDLISHRKAAPVRPLWIRLALPVAAALLLLIGAWWLMRSGGEAAAPIVAKDPESLYQTYFRRVPLSSTLGSPTANTDYARARQFYSEGRCDEAMALLEKAVADPGFEERPMALLLQGTCLLEVGNTAESLRLLKAIPPSARIPYQHAQWYTALAYLRAGQRALAEAQLRDIAERPHLHQAAARALLGRE